MATNEGESRFRAPHTMSVEGENNTPEEREPATPQEEEFNILPPIEIIVVSPEGDNPFRQDDPYQTFTYRSAFSDKEEEPETQTLYPERSALVERIAASLRWINDDVVFPLSSLALSVTVGALMVKAIWGAAAAGAVASTVGVPAIITLVASIAITKGRIIDLIADLPRLMFPKKKKKTVAA